MHVFVQVYKWINVCNCILTQNGTLIKVGLSKNPSSINSMHTVKCKI